MSENGERGIICQNRLIFVPTHESWIKNTSLLGLPVGFGYGYESLMTLILKTLSRLLLKTQCNLPLWQYVCSSCLRNQGLALWKLFKNWCALLMFLKWFSSFLASQDEAHNLPVRSLLPLSSKKETPTPIIFTQTSHGESPRVPVHIQ